MILNVKNLTHGFGDRAIFDNVSFRLLKGEHIGLIGANGEGKSTFMNIITGKLTPDEGTVEWAKNVRVGYLDQHSVLEKGMTIGDVLRSAFQFLFAMEAEMNRMYEQMGDATPEEMERLLAETGTYQELLEQHDFYMIDTKVDEIASALGLEELGLDRDVTDLSGGQRTRVLMAKLLLETPGSECKPCLFLYFTEQTFFRRLVLFKMPADPDPLVFIDIHLFFDAVQHQIAVILFQITKCCKSHFLSFPPFPGA